MSMIYYHNPKCTKSRAGLSILEKEGLQFQTRLYLENPLTEEEMKKLLQKLNMKAREFIRKKEAQELEIDLNQDEAQLIEILSLYPSLVERPILELDDRAVIGRPTENIIKFLEKISL